MVATMEQPMIVREQLPPYTRTQPSFWQPSWPSFEARFDGKRNMGVTAYRLARVFWVAIFMPLHVAIWVVACVLRLDFLVPDSALPGSSHGWTALQRLFMPALKRFIWAISDIGAGPNYTPDQERAGKSWSVTLLQRVFNDGAHHVQVKVEDTRLEGQMAKEWIRDEAVDPRGKIQPGHVPLYFVDSSVGKKDDIRKVEYCSRKAKEGERVVLYLVGGGYVAGNPLEGNRCFVIAHRTGLLVVGANFRKAGVAERAYPAALQDVITAHAKLIQLGYRDIVLAGDSAGGGLAMSLLLYLSNTLMQSTNPPPDLVMPTGLLLYSPEVDLTLASSRNGLPHELKDDLINPSMLYLSSSQYLITTNNLPADLDDPSSPFVLGPFHPFLSPALLSSRPALSRLAAVYTTAKPLRVLLFSSAAELLGPESRALAENLRTVQGVKLEFHEEPGEVHCYPLVPKWISPAAGKALDRVESWLKEDRHKSS